MVASSNVFSTAAKVGFNIPDYFCGENRNQSAPKYNNIYSKGRQTKRTKEYLQRRRRLVSGSRKNVA
jgi:hypothetical protein